MRATVSTSILTILLLFACSSSAEDLTGREQSDQASNSAPITPNTTLDTPTSTTMVPKSSKTSVSLENIDEPEFGAGGLVADLESWADRDLPLFITASHRRVRY